ncbi:type II secretion system minor pseudopilin GspJ [Vibrio aestuarianus]|uniref:type II secretion system minor pseudopilin GspJ n=1 Tax=Vibrio aestuarianus TaxID=28171 RepID=UPI00237D09FE|nr:type II secretion system minor pseudopilin GspJ [Vibrio aestuarianus]MDE1239304.1 type II secretion system minor pseudopilin GspJ [Vibrio aestuarianus]MDE1318872.1 type II secretion system minor pseudopilin GspJ [Vibrio aestuarianus]MDE1325982.1 type II secretion system minor pseudopilin GspJ [Vibrio aestuarianus]
MSSNKKRQGFTLIEVLVAIAIFASLSVGAYQVLNQVQRSNEISQQRSQRLNALQRAMVLMDGDFRQMATRQFRTNGEEPNKQILQWKEYLLDSDQKGVLFARLGWHNPQQQFPRGEVTKVGYRIKEGVLERVWWRYPDTPAGQDGIITPLLSDVESMSLRFYSNDNWSEDWQESLKIPQAVAVKLVLKDYGEIERIYLTSGGAINQNTQGADNDAS